ncbi:hypothetical protein [Borreliella lusitaniae]|uniref:Outer membrane protein n=1 Tax=Borreliella lusitaniae TaxID=100177 RepID=A0ABZ0CIS2_9SPIR|nr:hypothetical protein [Borreliella lusitaniae]WKC84888.1 hypothetical protein QIA24_00365 [Borreliella lusitaniae]WNY69113.1 hypothetical protein QIA44_04605 [Borreliella lusitaniae]
MKKTIIVFFILAFMFNCTKKSDDAELNNDPDKDAEKLQSDLVDDDRIEFNETMSLKNLDSTEKETVTFLINLLKEKLIDPSIGLNFKNAAGDENKIEETLNKFLSDLREDEIKEMLAKIKENKDLNEKDPEKLNAYKNALASGFDGIFSQADPKTIFNSLKDAS